MNLCRRRFLQSAGLIALTCEDALAGILAARQPPAAGADAQVRPEARLGLQIGDVSADRAVIWSRADRPGRLQVEWSLDPAWRQVQRLHGPLATGASDYTARVDLRGLPPDADIFVRLSFVDPGRGLSRGAPLPGHFRSAPARSKPLHFLWSGDTVGQGWGSNPAIGGMRIYESMRREQPAFFLHSGDTIYADNPLTETVGLPDGTLWHNAYLDLEPAKRQVAQQVDDFRGCYRYNLHDPAVRRFNAEVPQLWQWDDHEVCNNWSPGKDLSDDARYQVKDIATLAAHARRAFLEYAPLRPQGADAIGRIYRKIPYGPDLDVFMLDARSYRAANSYNRQPQPDAATRYFGAGQLAWLQRELAASTATWKVIANDMPLGMMVSDGKDGQGQPRFENSSNGRGPVLGREFEIAAILSFIKRERIRNTLWITADVHYCAALHYHPERAQFKDFDPFWEFVAGPLNAGTFGPNPMDDTFGPDVVFQRTPPPGQANLSPAAGMQFYGRIDIDPELKQLSVSLKDIDGRPLHRQTLQAQPV